jgi:hypothetical protein
MLINAEKLEFIKKKQLWSVQVQTSEEVWGVTTHVFL